MAKDEDEVIGILVGLGILVVAGSTIYRIIKAIGGYKEGEIVSAGEAVAIAPYIPTSVKPEPPSTIDCPKHGEQPKCGYCGGCVECGGGPWGGWCYECEEGWNYRNNDSD